MTKRFLESNSTPAYFFDKLLDITPDNIKEMGGKAIGLDIDNTIAIDSTYALIPGAYEWVKRMQNSGYPVMIISNTMTFRAKYFSKLLDGIPYIGNSKKPKSDGYIKAAKTMGVKISELVMIGDQLFSDVQGANNSGAISVRVKYMKREIIMMIRFILLRRREKQYLISKGLGDMI